MKPTIQLPKVYRLWVTKFNPDPKLFQDLPEIGEWWNNRTERPENEFRLAQAIEFAGRNCYRSWRNPSGRKTSEYISNLIRQKHWSVLEHVSVGYLIWTSREVTHELVRHRHLSYSQESTRYVDVGNVLVNVPHYLLDHKEDREKIEAFLQQASAIYRWAEEKAQKRYRFVEDLTLQKKLIRQDARRLGLPTAAETRIVVTGNLRAWMEAIEKRVDYHADWPIRLVFLKILEDLDQLVPEVFRGRWRVYLASDGYMAAHIEWEG